MNLAERDPKLSHEPFCEALESSFIEHYGGTVERETLSLNSAGQQNAIVQSNYERLKSWDWLYGQCPEFKYSIDHKFSWGMT